MKDVIKAMFYCAVIGLAGSYAISKIWGPEKTSEYTGVQAENVQKYQETLEGTTREVGSALKKGGENIADIVKTETGKNKDGGPIYDPEDLKRLEQTLQQMLKTYETTQQKDD